MPELPEVETTRRGIAPHISGQRFTCVDVRDARLRWPVSDALAKILTGNRVKSVRRRGKYLLIECDHGCLLIHLGMSGSLRLCAIEEPPLKHDHVIFYFEKKLSLRFNDARRFGCIVWTELPPEQHKLLASLGPEPLHQTFNADYLFKRSRKRKLAIKNFIMDSAIVVGVGNIYANEALFLSGIRPRTAASRITHSQCQTLIRHIKQVLEKAIKMGGSTLRDFVGGDGKPGYFQQTFNVYGRAGEPCINCSTPIKQIVVGQRGTFYCPECQR